MCPGGGWRSIRRAQQRPGWVTWDDEVPEGRRVTAHLRVREAPVLCGRDWFDGGAGLDRS